MNIGVTNSQLRTQILRVADKVTGLITIIDSAGIVDVLEVMTDNDADDFVVGSLPIHASTSVTNQQIPW